METELTPNHASEEETWSCFIITKDNSVYFNKMIRKWQVMDMKYGYKTWQRKRKTRTSKIQANFASKQVPWSCLFINTKNMWEDWNYQVVRHKLRIQDSAEDGSLEPPSYQLVCIKASTLNCLLIQISTRSGHCMTNICSPLEQILYTDWGNLVYTQIKKLAKR